MLKFIFVLLSAALILGAPVAHAGFGVPGAPSSVNKGVKTAGGKAGVASCNSSLKKLSCHFANNETTTEHNCNVKEIEKTISDCRNVLETMFTNDIDVSYTCFGPDYTTANNRLNQLLSEMSSPPWYDKVRRPKTSKGNNKCSFEISGS